MTERGVKRGGEHQQRDDSTKNPGYFFRFHLDPLRAKTSRIRSKVPYTMTVARLLGNTTRQKHHLYLFLRSRGAEQIRLKL
jgi:hypothetical protein